MLLNHLFLINPLKFYFGQGLFLIISLYDFRKIPYYIPVLLLLLIVSTIIPVFIPIEFVAEFVLFSFIAKHIVAFLVAEHVIIFFIILKRTVLYSFDFKKLNIFHFVLLFFEITAILRFIIVLENSKADIIYFYLMVALGILIGIFFLFYNEKNSPEISLEKSVRSTE
jgi:hypothetical protein